MSSFRSVAWELSQQQIAATELENIREDRFSSDH